MVETSPPKRAIVESDNLPSQFPTNHHAPEFWESLGRTVATFGYLEEILGKAIFSFTATKPYSADEIDAAYKKWLPTLEKALSDPLGRLIKAFERAVKNHPHAKDVVDIDGLATALRTASSYRNVLCHGSWNKLPDKNGAMIPLFVNRDNQVFNTPINRQFLDKLQHEVVLVSCNIINSVLLMGWQFPGYGGPGKPILGG